MGCLPERYRLFDLSVQSDIPIEEAVHSGSDRAADVTVKLGEISADPHSFPNTRHYGFEKKWWYSLPERNRFLFNTPAGVYEVRDGNRITICPEPDADMLLVRTYLLGTAFGALQIHRGLFPIHGGTVEVNGKALVFTGGMGAGKSTMTDELIRRSYRYLADDVSTVTVESGLVQVLPAYPQRKLCLDYCITRGYHLESMVLISEERSKYSVRRIAEWRDSRLPLGWIAQIVPNDEKEVRIQRVDGHEKLRFLIANFYRSFLHSMRGIEPPDMKRLFTIAASTEMYRLFRPQGIDMTHAMLELLFERLGVKLNKVSY